MSNLTKIKFRYLIIGCVLFALLVALVMVKVTDMLNDPLRNKQIVKSFDNDRVLILQDKQGNLSVGYRLNEEECGIKIYELNTAQDNDNWQDELTEEEYKQLEIPIKQVIDIDSLEMTYDAKYEHFYTFQDNNNTYSMTIHLCDASVFSFERKRDYQLLKQLDDDLDSSKKLWLSRDNKGYVYFSHSIAEKCPDDEINRNPWVVSADLQNCDPYGYLSSCYFDNSKPLAEVLDLDSLKITKAGYGYYYLEDKNNRYEMGYSQCNSKVFYEEKSATLVSRLRDNNKLLLES